MSNDVANLRHCYRSAYRSPDPSTQNGALLFHIPGRIPILETASCNEFPFGVAYLEERWERPAKYGFIEHAERNAIFKAASLGIRTQGLGMAAAWAACADCARAIIQAGIHELVRHEPSYWEGGERWLESIAVGDTMLKEAGVKITVHKDTVDVGLAPIRRDGALWQP